jgi:hypothetical protein
MLDCYWTVLDLIAPNNPFKVLPGWRIELGVQRTCGLSVLDLPLMKPVLFSETVLIKVNLLSLGSK